MLLAMDRETCQIQLPNGPTSFRSTVVKPFRKEPDSEQETDSSRAFSLVENLPKDVLRVPDTL
jgi:hypothetical protein